MRHNDARKFKSHKTFHGQGGMGAPDGRTTETEAQANKIEECSTTQHAPVSSPGPILTSWTKLLGIHIELLS